MRAIVAYFSAEGTTANVARIIADKTESDIFEITPLMPYSASDINWKNPLARCNREKIGRKEVAVVGKIENFNSYDTVFLGFPIWYYGAPNVVKTFCSEYDWNGKNVYIFATSGGSKIGKTAENLKPYISGANVISADVYNDTDMLETWLNSLKVER